MNHDDSTATTESPELAASTLTDREHQEARNALRQSEEKFSKAFRASPDAIIISSIAEGKMVDVNDGFKRLSGYSRKEVLGHTTLELNLWADPEERAQMVDIMRREGRVRELSTNIRTKSGELRPTVISVEIIELKGQPHLLVAARDVTELRRVEQERTALIEELKAKNSELQRFTYTVSHDLKSPLLTIRGFLGLLEKDAAAGDTQRLRGDIERIRSAATTMGQLLDDLLELSRIGRMINPSEAIALSELARQAADHVAGRLIERGVEVEIADDMSVVFGDRQRLLEVLQNLLDNAAKFMGDQSEPRIEVGERPGEGEESDRVLCYVRDNGKGLDPRFHEKIFGLFDRLDPQVEGTGIGLTLVERIVEVHGGRVWAESEGVGTGCTFCFSLPRAPSTVPCPGEDPSASAS